MPVQTRKRKATEADLAPVPEPPTKKQQSKASTKGKDEPQKHVTASTRGDHRASGIALSSAYKDFTVQGDKGKDIPCQAWPSSSASHPAPESARGTTLIFTHGAGGGLSNPATRLFAEGYVSATAEDEDASCVLFQGNMNLQSRVKSFESVLSHLQAGTPNQTFAVGGRSMGARAAVMVAAAHEEIRKVVCVSYPLTSPKGEIRDQMLLDLPAEKEVLFVSGSVDSMCDVMELGKVMAKMEAKSTLVVVEDADHGMSMMYMARHGLKGEKKEDVISRVKNETGRIAAKWIADPSSVESGWRIDYDAVKDGIVTGPRAEEVGAHRVEGDMDRGKENAVEEKDANRKSRRRKRGKKQDGKDGDGEATDPDHAVGTAEHEEVASSSKHTADAGAERVVNSVKYSVNAAMNVIPWLEKVGTGRESWEEAEASSSTQEECSGEALDEESADEEIDEEDDEEDDAVDHEEDDEQAYREDYEDELYLIELLAAFAQRQMQSGNRGAGHMLKAAGLMWLLTLDHLRHLDRIYDEGEEVDEEELEEIERQEDEARAFKRELTRAVVVQVTRLTE